MSFVKLAKSFADDRLTMSWGFGTGGCPDYGHKLVVSKLHRLALYKPVLFCILHQSCRTIGQRARGHTASHGGDCADWVIAACEHSEDIASC